MKRLKIAVIGPGAMGMLFAAKLSQTADTVLIGNNRKNIAELQAHGVHLKDGDESVYPVPSFLNGEYREPADLVILFTKAYLTEEAISANRNIISPDTYLLTLQNGMGHADVLGKFASPFRILIGTTEEGSSRENAYAAVHTGRGKTVFGFPHADAAAEEGKQAAERFAELFSEAGFPCTVSDDISRAVWNKLMINASTSVLCGVIQKPQGFLAGDPYARMIWQGLIREICAAAEADGYHFDPEEQIERLQNHLQNAPDGFPSIAADLKNGRKTEVDFISGAVVRSAEKNGLMVPYEKLMVQLVHAMETKSQNQ